MRKRMKNIALLVLVVLMFGSFSPSLQVNAEQIETSTPIVADEVVYEKVELETFVDLYGVEAPTKQGYYFGGWYVTADETQPIGRFIYKADIIAAGEDVYAKFVPSYMLNVKAQNSSSLDERDGKWETAPDKSKSTSVRMISAVDSRKYREVGFHVFVNGKRVSKMETSKYNITVYDKVVVTNKAGETVKEYTAKDLFGLTGDNYDPKLMIAKFINIPENGWKTSIYVRPYWITYDGIEVRGNGKYLHVEDGIKRYISIPINLQSLNENTTGIVAGRLEVNYDKDRLTFIDSIDGNNDAAYKVGGVLDTAGVRLIEEGKIRCVAIEKADGMKNVIPNQMSAAKRQNEKDVTHDQVNNMFITLRFQVKTTKTATGSSNFMEFEVENMDFCDTAEADVSVNIWNSRY